MNKRRNRKGEGRRGRKGRRNILPGRLVVVGEVEDGARAAVGNVSGIVSIYNNDNNIIISRRHNSNKDKVVIQTSFDCLHVNAHLSLAHFTYVDVVREVTHVILLMPGHHRRAMKFVDFCSLVAVKRTLHPVYSPMTSVECPVVTFTLWGVIFQTVASVTPH